ncbi:hypothetical protein FIU87_21135 [Bacillus sp. THAF10]|uniref:hypothetical protein n=1 Tax=Bacillus sp. THAF10 TaxID=2587848 RepID=UPI0012A9A60D|nr:hypothetical protein [Bacillus sp. THAF10]QFT91159.1 hypothetical protein FIU87_21135 [Bacillus sp. THAF10]
MGLYKAVCYKVEDIFVKALSTKQEPNVVREKVSKYRTEKEVHRLRKKEQKAQNL